MDPIVAEWLNLIVRWTHVITGIAWIGSSFFFMWLDARLEVPDNPRPGIEGALWLVHSGGFYQVEKMKLAPSEVPATLHWFKWEAMFTGITGFLMLVLVYYMGSGAFLMNPEIDGIGHAGAVAISVGLLAGCWLVYELMYRSPLRRAGAWAEVTGAVLLVVLAWALGQVFSDRAAYVHVGAVLGTIMVANVWVIIVPGQRRLVAATLAGTPPDPADAANAKQRSVHNNYMTLPVVFIMLSSHYPSTYGHEHAWAVLVALFAIGAVVRHWFNLRNAGRRSLWPVPAATVAMAALIYVISAGQARIEATAGDGEPVSFAAAYDVIAKRCISCHAKRPTDENFRVAPKNVVFDTPAQIRNQAAKIRAVAVLTRTMPLGNATRMTDAERALLGRWIANGSEIE